MIFLKNGTPHSALSYKVYHTTYIAVGRPWHSILSYNYMK